MLGFVWSKINYKNTNYNLLKKCVAIAIKIFLLEYIKGFNTLSLMKNIYN